MPKPLVAVITIVIIILVGLGAWWLLASQPTQPAANRTTTTSQNQPSAPSADGITIVFTDDGFEQQSYSVTAGQTVTVKNQASIDVEFSSDEHPTHTDNPELNMDVLNPGEQTIFTPETAGEWGIHDHEHPQFTTALTVL